VSEDFRPADGRQLWRVSELAAATGLREPHIRKLVREGAIDCVRAGRLVMIPAPEVERVMREGAPYKPTLMGPAGGSFGSTHPAALEAATA